MENINFTLKADRTVQLVRYKLRQLGWQGLMGVLLILGSLIYLFIVAIPKTQQLQQLQMEVTALKANPKQNVKNGSNNTQLDVVQKFYALLPSQKEANSKITDILNVATKTGLVVDKVEYDQPLSASPLIKYQIKLPLKGSYTQIRQFINQVLNTLPSIALNDISLRREDITTDLVEARIQFTLYLQNVKR
jgi:Tfp pilus assembly protein PilO